jgi:2-iminobutanoate/2-iminopropanoate deaminase
MVGGGNIVEETKQVLINAKEALAASGATFGDVVKTTILLDEFNDFAQMNAVYSTAFENTGKPPPARSCFAAKDLPKGAKVEIEWMAVID